jgi:hypothetical protein
MQNEEKKAFYNECGKILNITHEWNDPVPRRTRWNTRLIGNGRFPGFGLIRCYGHQIMVTSKDGTKMFNTCDSVYKYLTTVNIGIRDSKE